MQRLSIILLCVASVWGWPPKPRIINGEKAAEGQFPWQAALYVVQFGKTNLCGGALISDSWILTAAHCVDSSSSIRIALGSNNLVEDDSNRVVFNTDQYVSHENYSSLTLINDIALIPLPEAVTFNDDVRPIDLASSEISPGQKVTVSGWGLTRDGGDGASPDLIYVDLVIIPDSDCEAAYGYRSDGVFCAQGGGSEVQSTCEGDSGGPLVTGVSTNPVHVGIVSYGHGDGCESGKPGGFTRTDYFRDWISDKTGV